MDMYVTTALAGGTRAEEGLGAGALFRLKPGVRGLPEFLSRIRVYTFVVGCLEPGIINPNITSLRKYKTVFEGIPVSRVAQLRAPGIGPITQEEVNANGR